MSTNFEILQSEVNSLGHRTQSSCVSFRDSSSWASSSSCSRSRRKRTHDQRRGTRRHFHGWRTAGKDHNKRKKDRTHSPFRLITGTVHSWGERMDVQPTEKPVYDAHVKWPSSDEEHPEEVCQDEEPEVPGESALVEVLKEIRRFLVDKCTQGVAKKVRRRTQSRFPLPKVTTTKTPQLDPLMKAEASAGATARD